MYLLSETARLPDTGSRKDLLLLMVSAEKRVEVIQDTAACILPTVRKPGSYPAAEKHV